jgi:hypothetical protein
VLLVVATVTSVAMANLISPTADVSDVGGLPVEHRADFPGPGPGAFGFVTDVLAADSNADVRVNDGSRTGQLAGCNVQSEPSLTADGETIYVGYNDAGQCLDSLTGAAPTSWTGFARSDDGGRTFQDIGPLRPGGPIRDLYGDALVAVDTSGENAGRVYVASLANTTVGASTIAIGRSDDRGATFTWSRVWGHGGGFQDKEWLAVDNTGGPYDGSLYLTWTDFTTTTIMFSWSADGGATWSRPKQVQQGGDVQAARPAVGPDGEVYVVWEAGTGTASPRIMWTRSTDGGDTFLKSAVAATTSTTGATGACLRPSLNANIRTQEFPSVAVDTFGTGDPQAADYNPSRGTVYVTYAAHGAGTDEADVRLIRLPADQDTWSPAVRVNDDTTTTDQFFPEVAVTGPGHVALAWTDRREDAAAPSPAGNRMMAQYFTTSDDGGATLAPNRRLSEMAFPPPHTLPNSEVAVATCYAGDYNALAADGRGGLIAAWGDNRDDIAVNMGETPVIPDPNVYFTRRSLQP